MKHLDGPPALILGGDDIGLSVARSLGRLGVRTYAVAHPFQRIRYSRYAQWVPLPGNPHRFWDECRKFLTGPSSDHLAGAVLIATQDEAVELVAGLRNELKEKFLLDPSNPEAHKIMLDKIATYEVAERAGVPVPRYWTVRSRSELDAISGELTWPLIVKPRHGHLFKAKFNAAKHIRAHNLQETVTALEAVAGKGIEVFLVETIPGPDQLFCSYYTYLNEAGETCYDVTKRVIRRYPSNMGQTTYQVTDHVPGIRELSLRLFREAGLHGVANVEYKLDPRNREYKLIECNARITGGNPLVLRSGVNVAEVVYRQAAGLPPKKFAKFRTGVRMWNPRRDFAAYRELHALGRLGFGQWVASLLHPQHLAAWSLDDPGPAVLPFAIGASRKLTAMVRPRRSRLPA